MRNTSQGQNSSVDSYNDSSVTNPTSDQPINSNQEGNIKLFRTPRFFKSISNQSLKYFFLSFKNKYFIFQMN
jgi:hypothetical protein